MIRTRRPFAFILAALLLFTAAPPLFAQDDAEPETATAESAEAGTDAESEAESDSEEATEAESANSTVIEMSDGLRLAGQIGGDPDAATWLVIFPNLDESIEDYTPLVERISGAGVLSLYPRGVGESTSITNGGSVDYRDFDPRGTQQGFLAMIGDAGEVATWLRNEQEAQHIIFLGSRITANMLAEAAGVEVLGSGVGLVLLSPGEVLRGFRLTEENFKGADLGSLVVYGEQDAYTSRVVGEMRHASDLTRVEVEGTDRGATLLEDDAAIDAIVMFLAARH